MSFAEKNTSCEYHFQDRLFIVCLCWCWGVSYLLHQSLLFDGSLLPV